MISVTVAFKYAALCKIVSYSESKSICLRLHPSTQYTFCEPIISGSELGIWDAVMGQHRTSPRPQKRLVGERNVSPINTKINILFQIMVSAMKNRNTAV